MNDLISNLPDEILCHILSFLKTKEVALTSVLSKRWQNLIAYVPNLDIGETVSREQLMKKSKEGGDRIPQSFIDFVDRILALQGNSVIKKFKLRSLNGSESDLVVDAWIRNVIKRGVSELTLSIFSFLRTEHKYCVSPQKFESMKLVKLEILNDIDIDSLHICFPMLKTLTLASIRISVDMFHILLHDLPKLEDLFLHNIEWRYRDSFHMDVSVSSASLKTLTISCSDFLNTLSFDTPSLVHFWYIGLYVPKDYPLVTMENLLEATIDLFWWFEKEDIISQARDDENNFFRQYGKVWKLLNGIRNVQYLNLSTCTVEVLSQCCESMPVFKNLKSLALSITKSRGWKAFASLLRRCPQLETLVLEGLLHDVRDNCGDACDCLSRQDKGISLSSCLVKVIKIKCFQGTMKEMHMIKHFSDYFPCLKEIKIYLEEDDLTQLRFSDVSEVIVEKLELYSKSSSCNIQLLVNGCLYKKWTAQ